MAELSLVKWLGFSYLVTLLAVTAAIIIVPGIRSGWFVGILGAALICRFLGMFLFFPLPPPGAELHVILAWILMMTLAKAIQLWIVGKLVPDFEVRGLGSGLLGGLIMTMFEWAFAFPFPTHLTT